MMRTFCGEKRGKESVNRSKVLSIPLIKGLTFLYAERALAVVKVRGEGER